MNDPVREWDFNGDIGGTETVEEGSGGTCDALSLGTLESDDESLTSSELEKKNTHTMDLMKTIRWRSVYRVSMQMQTIMRR